MVVSLVLDDDICVIFFLSLIYFLGEGRIGSEIGLMLLLKVVG